MVASVSEIVQFVQHFPFLVSFNIQKLRIQKFCYLKILLTNLTLQLFKSQHISTSIMSHMTKYWQKNQTSVFRAIQSLYLKVNIKSMLTATDKIISIVIIKAMQYISHRVKAKQIIILNSSINYFTIS